MTHTERDAMACQVVDFSVSQTTGFTLAYMESITPVKRNRTVILGHEEEPFQKACMDLLELVTPEGPTHQEKIDAMYCQYPKVHKWLDWWTTADVTSKTFRARKPRQEDSADGLPDTTNGQESMHRLYYMIRGRLECSNEGGLDLLQDQGAKGHLPINGKRNHQAPSDGRPPDTLDALAEVPGKKAKWQTTGVGTVSGIICKACSIAKPPVPSKSQTKKPCLKKINSDISVVQDPAPSDQSLHQLYETSLLTFDNSPPPLHLYFYMDISTLHTRGPTSEFYHTQRQPNSDRSEFMDTTNWPLKLTVGGAEYTLMSRGYWNGIHYWCKVYRTHEGITGVWLHNNADNAGWARFIHHNPKDKYVTTAIKKISANHLDPPGELSVNLMNQLRCQPSESRGHPLQADVHNNKQAAENKQFTLLESDLANLDQEETLTQSAIISQTPNTCPKRTRLPSGSHLLDHDGKEQAPSQAEARVTDAVIPEESPLAEPPSKKVVIADPPTQSQPVKLLPKRPLRPRKIGSALLEPPKDTKSTSDNANIIIRFKIKPPSPATTEASAPAPQVLVPASEPSAEAPKLVVMESRQSKRNKGVAVTPS
ncbi:hypothetical protein PSHT_02677 [Puccinia striiformis]|uniref:Uncharacterized protein n=1 Tax=Puccinia striiformis TaxID=27350 RepID=A0A2S4WHM1_9BASI|nr:hypothetical protein PSHT_02677 [Puccinia striiformis]